MESLSFFHLLVLKIDVLIRGRRFACCGPMGVYVVVGISCQNRLSKLVVGIAMVLLAILRIGCQYWFDIRKVLIKNRREIAYLRR